MTGRRATGRQRLGESNGEGREWGSGEGETGWGAMGRGDRVGAMGREAEAGVGKGRRGNARVDIGNRVD